MSRPPQKPLADMNPPELVDELQWWSEHADTSTPYGQTLSRLLAAAADMVRLGVPCPQCSAEAVACVTLGDRKWLKCAGCGADFAPEQATFQAGFRRGLAEGAPTKQQDFCQHGTRIGYEPSSSIGDESDYESRCLDCKKLLRMAPNA